MLLSQPCLSSSDVHSERYAYAAVAVSGGAVDTLLVLPHANSQCMQIFLD
jgi:hypothetical protein